MLPIEEVTNLIFRVGLLNGDNQLGSERKNHSYDWSNNTLTSND